MYTHLIKRLYSTSIKASYLAFNDSAQDTMHMIIIIDSE